MCRPLHRALLLPLFFTLAGCGDSPTMSELPDDAVILAFGDSLTEGVGARDDESYPALLQQLSGRTVVNAGISGEISEQGLKRLPGVLDKVQPRLLILCHGGNDLLRKHGVPQMEANVRAMISLAQERGIEVILLGVPRPGLFLSALEVYGDIADSMEVLYIDDLVPDVLGDNALKSDAVHPNKDGYRVMAEHIHQVLEQSGAI